MPPFRSTYSGGSMDSLGGLPLLCTFACVCCLISLLIAYFVWAIMTIVGAPEVPESDCGAKYNIWTFCLTVMIIIPILGCITSIIATLSKTPGPDSCLPMLAISGVT